MTVILYPRLARTIAMCELRELQTATDSGSFTPKCLDFLISRGISSTAPAETGGEPASETHLSDLRETTINAAMEFGFPGSPLKQADIGAFGSTIGRLLNETMSLIPGEAAREEIWSYINLRLLPDLAAWRYLKSIGTKGRFLGTPWIRNAFGHLWWRAHVLHDEQAKDPWHLLDAGLKEDTYVQILERAGMTAHGHVARAIAARCADICRTESNHEEVNREWIKYLRAKSSLTPLGILSAERLQALIEEAVESTRCVD
tara:strand:- start:980 stop:1756 length:777 start_codon:yes stop_codon:yes gene_type:complete